MLVQAVASPPPPPGGTRGSRVQVLVSLAPGASAAAVTAMQQALQASVASGQLADSLRVAGALRGPTWSKTFVYFILSSIVELLWRCLAGVIMVGRHARSASPDTELIYDVQHPLGQLSPAAVA